MSNAIQHSEINAFSDEGILINEIEAMLKSCLYFIFRKMSESAKKRQIIVEYVFAFKLKVGPFPNQILVHTLKTLKREWMN
jgi:hypothetical protein